MNAEEVLDVLAFNQESLNWLANDGRQYLADARLSVFRSNEHFAVFTEFPHYNYRATEFSDWLGCAGNCLIRGAYKTQYQTPRDELLQQVTGAPLWNDPDERHRGWQANRNSFSVYVQGRRFDFTPSKQDYGRASLTFEHENTNTINPGQLLRFVNVALGHPFFYSESELRALINPSVESGMSLFLQTTRWQHPPYLMRDSDTFDSPHFILNIPCWQILARAIVSGDLSEWDAQDTSGFNTDWASLERIYREGNSGYGFD